jgi:predicted small lipoprotein YifL
MGIDQKILVRGVNLRVAVATALCAALVLSACGQKGNLYLPNDPEFKQRATLPEIVRRQLPGATSAPATPTTPATSPAATPASAAAPAVRSPAVPASAATGR